ncbi:hypothetical protein RsoP1IDN_7 [Ralstonia phage RsoP1IDN]|uniref:Uncharacterized protein n=1 Tax=Ralstonia phage RsoP1IDN TaxID=2060091 RepID=A0A2P0VPF3_9CAUD|nr:hypothetical protein HOS84_gp07 [Ralstonia phage RsoP1IDN]AUG85410.1 hypothetical protein RsoP1IDN_7 [Ralstonia phage RsoP1IDN]
MAHAHQQHLKIARLAHRLAVAFLIRGLRSAVAHADAAEEQADRRQREAFAAAQAARDHAEDLREAHYDALVHARNVQHAAREEAALVGGKL